MEQKEVAVEGPLVFAAEAWQTGLQTQPAVVAGWWKPECPLAMSASTASRGKKGNDTESFTGIMHMELCEKVDDDAIGPALSADVYDDLLVDAQVLDGTWQDLGNILGSVVTLGKSVHGGSV